jgi:PAS domain S-box-containing protein
MLEQLSDQIRECHERAAEAKARADETNDPGLKAEFLNTESRWLTLARSYSFTESLEDFTAFNSERRRNFDERLRANVRSAWGSFFPWKVRSRFLWSIIDNSDDAIITKNLGGIITSWNKSAERLFGYTAEEAIGKPITMLIPPERYDEESAILADIGRGERVHHYETVRQCKDGSLVDISLTVSPVTNAQGEIVGASKIARDITERKRKDEHIAVLAREADHRTKNILAIVQATVNLSHSGTAHGLKRDIEGRIRALANVHSLFVESRWAGAELSSVVTQELAPYLERGEARAQIDGPHVWLPTNTAQTIAMILHELATNSVKYGSLSVPEGHLCLKWLTPADGQLSLHWTETGGPSTKRSVRKAFGISEIEQIIRQQGEIHLDWRPEGLACEIILQTSKL